MGKHLPSYIHLESCFCPPGEYHYPYLLSVCSDFGLHHLFGYVHQLVVNFVYLLLDAEQVA